MPVYRQLRDFDILQTVLTPSRRVEIVSGNLGWRGADASGSISFYQGARGIGGSRLITSTTGSAYPRTASIFYGEMRPLESSDTAYRWGRRKWETVDSLYRYYSRYNPAYSTGTYDYQCIFFRNEHQNIVVAHDASASLYWQNVSRSICLEAWVMPFTTQSQHNNGHTILSRTSLYWMGLTGSDSRLTFSSSLGFHTSSMGVPVGQWSHVAVSVGNGTGTLYVNLSPGKTFNYTQTSVMQMTASNFVPLFCVGNTFGGSTTGFNGNFYEAPTGVGTTRSFFGLIHETREWSGSRSWQQISSSHDRRITLTEAGPLLYFPMIEGHRSGTTISSTTIGSSSLNYSSSGTFGSNIFYRLNGFSSAPTWLPNNNTRFYPQKTLMKEANASGAGNSYTRRVMRVMNIPKMFYGRQIVTGSFEMISRTFTSGTIEMMRVVKDDGRGALYLKSYMSSSVDNEMDAAEWNRVGNIFYAEGIVVITDDSMLDFGVDQPTTSYQPNSALSVSFNGLTHIPVKSISCRLDGGEANGSLNETFYSGSDGRRDALHEETYITSVVFYDSRRRPVAVGRLATPLRKKQGDRVNLRFRKDF